MFRGVRPVISRVLEFRLAGLLSAWVAALLIVTWLVLTGRQVAMERGQRATAAFASVVEQHVGATVGAVNLTVGAIGDAYQLSQPVKNDPDFREMMARRLKDIPFVRAAFVIGPDGFIIHDTDYPNTPAVPLSDREYFRAHQADAARQGTAWPPILSRSGTGWFVAVTRPLGRRGEFEGVVVAAIQTNHFEQEFRAVGLPDDYLISLLHDRTFVASHPPLPNAMGQDFGGVGLYGAAATPQGSFLTSEGLQPGERMVSYRRVDGTPFVVRVSRSVDAVVAEWRRTATGAALAMLTLTLFLAWMIVRLARESAQRARRRERRAQAEKLEALGQLSGGIAHDFANLLQIVSVNASLLRARPGDRAVSEQAFAALERAVSSGQQVAGRLLAFARRRSLTLTRVRLDTWLESARPLLEQAAGPGLALLVETEPALPEILCPVGELDVTLVNLIVNARDAMDGNGSVRVRAYACHEESGAPKAFTGKPAPFVCITVKDDGPGMAAHVLRRAPEPFYTTKGESGTGLGLSQAYGFMRQLGGQMVIDSAPGHGTAVHLYFPVAPESGTGP